MRESSLKCLFSSELFARPTSYADHPEREAALPDVSLSFLVEAARIIDATSVFEFGSGRSTEAFLEANLNVVSLEDSPKWMEET